MTFKPNGLPTLIGSIPLKDHREAVDIILKYTPEIPIWPQLPTYSEERLLTQFAEGLPGIVQEDDRLYFDTSLPDFDEQVVAFFEDYLAVKEEGASIEESRFAFSASTSRGFDAFLEAISQLEKCPFALKGQITGPFTMLTGIKDQEGKLSFFNPILREAVVKAISLKAFYQVKRMKELCPQVILFLDEPALAGFGSSQMVGITREDAISDLKSVVDEVAEAGAVAGIHVCANTDWSLVMDAGITILSFDAYSYFDKLILYRDRLMRFLDEGNTIAWGLVPTLNTEDLLREDVSSLFDRWKRCGEEFGYDDTCLVEQSLITPSCGTGLLTIDQAERALDLTRALSLRIRGRGAA